MQQLIGYSDKKRKVAIELGVDPYSTNTVLQHELDQIAWASFAGGATFSILTMPIGGGAGAAHNVFVALSGQVSPRLQQELEARGITVQDRLAPGPLK